jgi:hypothetical protein
MRQLSLTFEPGIGSRNRTLREHLAAVIYHRGLVRVAGEIDTSPSKLSEKLSGASSDGKVRAMSVDELERYIERSGDVSPVYYLVDKYLHDPEVAKAEALARVGALVEQLGPLLEAAGLTTGKRVRRG